MQEHEIEAVELSALRIDELAPLIEALPSLDLHQFTYVSIHAPSHFPPHLEPWLTAQFGEVAANGYPVVVHPDAILQPDFWRPLGNNLASPSAERSQSYVDSLSACQQPVSALTLDTPARLTRP